MDWAHDIEFRRWARVPIICLTHRNSLQVHFIVHHNENERTFIFSFCYLRAINVFVMLILRLYYTTLHYTTLHYTTLHYTTLHYTTSHYTTLHYTTLRYPCKAIYTPTSCLSFQS